MDSWELARAADEISSFLSLDAAKELLRAVEAQDSPAGVRYALRGHAPTEVQGLLSPLISDAGLERTCAALAAAVATRTRLDLETEQIRIVWTGPATVPMPNHRPTAAVMHELIASAKTHLTLATYSAGNVDDLIHSINQRRRDGVEIRLLLETVRSDGTGPNCPEVFKDLVGLPSVKALEWPRSARKTHDWTSMHVKVLIRDDDAVLVTSANFSRAAMRDNMELGVEIRGGTMAARLRQHFDELEVHGTLRKL
jgi:phosphatidylserine/phosphatidylglycerophosphate/cardiolipin synthase-like enzyme